MFAQKDSEITGIKNELESLQAAARKNGGDETQKKLDSYNDEILKMK
jgi:hypothetical protein